MRRSGEALEYASWKLRGDRKMAVVAVRQSDRALHFTSDKLKVSRVSSSPICEPTNQAGRGVT